MKFLLALAILLFMWWLALTVGHHNHKQARCMEDMPCWDCTTMGNRICGPTHDGRRCWIELDHYTSRGQVYGVYNEYCDR